MKPYQKASKILVRLKKNANRQFRKLSVLPIDCLNILNAKKYTQQAYKRMDAENRDAYLKIAQESYEDAGKLALLMGYQKKKSKQIDKKWVLAFLLTLHPITKYLYSDEAERKRLRLAEALASDRETGSRSAMRKDIKTSASLWWKQTEQFAIDIEDEAVMSAFLDYGVKKVKWITQLDDKACKTCRERNGMIYKISQVPDKPHYNCRCYLEPVSSEKM